MILRSSSRYVRAPIDKFGWYGLWIRHRLLKYILDGTPIVLSMQNQRTKRRTAIMSFFSFLGTEDCFTCIIPLLTWILDARLGRLFTILLSIGFYAAGFFKCFFCLPRPPTPPVIPLHKEEGDWAFPSNHGTVGVLLPWYLWIYSFLHYDWWPWWARLGLFLAASAWFFGVTLSRLYLGVHSVADMVAGAVVGVSILAVYVLVDDSIDYQCVAGQYVVAKAVVLANILLYIHPRTNPETNSYGESVILTGSTVGVVASRTITFSAFGRYSLVQSLTHFGEMPWQTLVWRSLLRLILGTSMIVGGRIVLKPFLRNLCYKFYSYLELPAYSYKDYSRQYPPTTKHYTSSYRLPPLSSRGGLSSTTTSRFNNDSEPDANDDGDDDVEAEKNESDNRKSENGQIRFSPLSAAEQEARTSSLRAACKRRVAAGLEKKDFQDSGDTDADDEEEEENENDEERIDALPYDVDIPSRFLVYSLLGWILGEGAPAVFDLVGI